MSDDPKTIKNGQGRPKKNNWTSEILGDMELDEIFTEIPKDFMIKVHRQEPEWCAGYLGTIHFEPDKPFSIDKLKEKFGGGLFILRIVDEQHKYRGQKTVRIADVPRENFQELEPDFLTLNGAQRRSAARGGSKDNSQAFSPFGAGFAMPPGIPPEMQRKLMRWYLMGDEGDKKSEKSTTAELMQQKMVMDMMQAQSNHQMQMQRFQLEYQRELEKMSRSREPQEPLSDVQQTISLLRELNGMKNEFGGSDHVATEIVSQTAPILETALTELIALQKLKVQSEIAKAKTGQPPARPLPARAAPRPAPPPQQKTVQNTPPIGQTVSPPTVSQPLNGTGRNPLQIAREMGEIYRRMGDADQQAILTAFMGDEIYQSHEEDIDDIEQKGNNISDTVMSDEAAETDSDLLDPEDRAVLESDDSDEADDTDDGDESNDETGDFSDGVDTGTTQNDDSLDRAGDTLGSGLSPD
jgi:hypothetical protein